MQPLASLLAVAALAATASAQFTTVLPQSAATIGGGTANLFPWGTAATAWPGLRIMCVYDSSHFTAAPVPITTPIFITSISWRADDTAASWTGGAYTNATVQLATAAVDYTGASTNWASNLGPDATVVHSGPVTVLPGTGNGPGVPGPYVVTVQVVPPFLYNPNSGDLVVDTDYASPGNYVGGTQVAMDVHTVNVLGSRVYGSSVYPGANGVDAACPVIQIGYSLTSGAAATNTTLGTGCVRSFTSFYEFFGSPASFDLGGTGLMMIPTGSGGYVVTAGGSFLPVGSVQTTPSALALGDDTEIIRPLTVGSFMGPSGPWTSMSIISNGIVSQASGNTLIAAPSPGTLLAGSQTGFYTQGDWDPIGGTGSGTIWFEENASVISITWDNVKSWNVAGTNTFQMQFYPSGLVTIVWVSMTPLGGNGGVMVGYSPGGPSLDPGNTDLSALTGVISLGTTDVPPLRVIGATRPLLGTNWNLTTSNIPATGLIGVDIFGLSDPNIPDLSFLGMPTCGLRASLDVLNSYLVTGATHNYSLAIPSSTTFLGVQVFTTGAVFQIPPVNAFGAITANGIMGTLGNV